MGLGVAHRGSVTQAGDSLTAARRHAQQARDLLSQGVDPIDAISEVDAPDLLKGLQGVRSLEDKNQRIPETLQRVRQRLGAVFEDAIFHNRCNSSRPDIAPTDTSHRQRRRNWQRASSAEPS